MVFIQVVMRNKKKKKESLKATPQGGGNMWSYRFMACISFPSFRSEFQVSIAYKGSSIHVTIRERMMCLSLY